MEQKLANCLNAFKIFVLVAIVLSVLMVVTGKFQNLWYVTNGHTTEWKKYNDVHDIRNPNIHAFPDSDLKKDFEIVFIKNLQPKYEQSVFQKIIYILFSLLEIWGLVIFIRSIIFIYKLSIPDLFELKTPIKFRKLVIQFVIIDIIFEGIQYYYYYINAIHTNIPHYQIGIFNIEQLDLHIIPSTIILLFLSYIWQYAISIKTENDLTV